MVNWGHILKKEYEFDIIEKRIAAYKKVTLDQVKNLFRKIFFDNPRRLNIKIHSHKHRDDTENRKTS